MYPTTSALAAAACNGALLVSSELLNKRIFHGVNFIANKIYKPTNERALPAPPTDRVKMVALIIACACTNLLAPRVSVFNPSTVKMAGIGAVSFLLFLQSQGQNEEPSWIVKHFYQINEYIGLGVVGTLVSPYFTRCLSTPINIICKAASRALSRSITYSLSTQIISKFCLLCLGLYIAYDKFSKETSFEALFEARLDELKKSAKNEHINAYVERYKESRDCSMELFLNIAYKLFQEKTDSNNAYRQRFISFCEKPLPNTKDNLLLFLFETTYDLPFKEHSLMLCTQIEEILTHPREEQFYEYFKNIKTIFRSFSEHGLDFPINYPDGSPMPISDKIIMFIFWKLGLKIYRLLTLGTEEEQVIPKKLWGKFRSTWKMEDLEKFIKEHSPTINELSNKQSG